MSKEPPKGWSARSHKADPPLPAITAPRYRQRFVIVPYFGSQRTKCAPHCKSDYNLKVRGIGVQYVNVEPFAAFNAPVDYPKAHAANDARIASQNDAFAW